MTAARGICFYVRTDLLRLHFGQPLEEFVHWNDKRFAPQSTGTPQRVGCGIHCSLPNSAASAFRNDARRSSGDSTRKRDQGLESGKEGGADRANQSHLGRSSESIIFGGLSEKSRSLTSFGMTSPVAAIDERISGFAQSNSAFVIPSGARNLLF